MIKILHGFSIIKYLAQPFNHLVRDNSSLVFVETKIGIYSMNLSPIVIWYFSHPFFGKQRKPQTLLLSRAMLWVGLLETCLLLWTNLIQSWIGWYLYVLTTYLLGSPYSTQPNTQVHYAIYVCWLLTKCRNTSSL